MSNITLPQGTRFAIATTLGATKTFTSASNASQCVLSFAADPSFAVGDVMEILTSGWDELVSLCVRVDAISGSGPYLVTLEDIDTSSTTLFPAGEGAGTCREVSAWTSLPLVGEASMSGGEVEQVPTPLLARTRVPTLQGGVSAIVYTLPCYFTQPMGAGYLAAVAAQDAATNVPIRRSHPAGDVQYGVAKWASAGAASLDRGAGRSIVVTAALQNKELSYAAA